MAKSQLFTFSSRLAKNSIFFRREAAIFFDFAAASSASVFASKSRRSFWHQSNSVFKSNKESGLAFTQFEKKMSRTVEESSKDPKKTDRISEDPKKNDRIIWVDLEMTGLEVETQTIVEMAVIVTDGELNIIAESPNLIINHDENVLEKMNDWCKENFTKSGLLEEIRQSKIALKKAEEIMINFVEIHTIAGKSPLAGNSVYMDKLFLQKYMPKFNDHLHYRILDVSTVKELSRRWYPKLHSEMSEKKLAHRALSDIRESIQELQWYRKNIFRPAS